MLKGRIMIAPKVPREKYLIQKSMVANCLFEIMKEKEPDIGYLSTKLLYDLMTKDMSFDRFSDEHFYRNIIVPKLRKLHPSASKKGFQKLARDIRIILDERMDTIKDLKKFLYV